MAREAELLDRLHPDETFQCTRGIMEADLNPTSLRFDIATESLSVTSLRSPFNYY